MAPVKSYSNRFWLYAPAGALFLAAALYAGYWHVTANAWSARLDAANGGEIFPGVTFAFADKDLSGFPFRLDMVLDGVTLSRRLPSGETALRMEKLAIHRMSYGADLYVLEATGLISLARPALKSGGAPSVLYITPGQAHASAILKGGKLARFDLDMLNVAAKDARAPDTQDRALQASRFQIHFLSETEQSIASVVKADGVKIGAGYEFPFPRMSDTLRMDATITNAASLAPLRAGAQDFDEAVENWRLAKGEVRISALAFTAKDNSVSLSGTLLPDTAHDLVGTLKDARGREYAVAHGEITPQ